MKNQKILKDFKSLKSVNNTEYKGALNDYQTKGNDLEGKKVMEYEVDKYSPYQNFLYKRATTGLKVYKPKQLRKMHKDKKDRIKRVHHKAQVILNIFKQKRLNVITNYLFSKWLPDAEITQYLIDHSETDKNFFCKLPFEFLYINKDEVVSLFIDKGILPKDFYSKTDKHET